MASPVRSLPVSPVPQPHVARSSLEPPSPAALDQRTIPTSVVDDELNIQEVDVLARAVLSPPLLCAYPLGRMAQDGAGHLDQSAPHSSTPCRSTSHSGRKPGRSWYREANSSRVSQSFST